MDLKLQGRNIQIDDSIRAYAAQKLNRLDRLLTENSLADVVVTYSTTRSQSDRITIQATINSQGVILRAEQRASDANAAIDSVVDILERKIRKFKTQTYRSKRTSTPYRVLEAEGAEQAVDPREGAILSDGTLLRLKQFPMDPMTVEEAALQMEMVGHSFYMFLNDESGQHNVLYRREDGNYGLIQPIDAEQLS
jgi:putative sigma-54 modulation protein